MALARVGGTQFRDNAVWEGCQEESEGKKHFGNQNFPKWEGEQQLAT
jgi:hypothetical protein